MGGEVIINNRPIVAGELILGWNGAHEMGLWWVGVCWLSNDQGWSTTIVNNVSGSSVNGVLMFPYHDQAISCYTENFFIIQTLSIIFARCYDHTTL